MKMYMTIRKGNVSIVVTIVWYCRRVIGFSGSLVFMFYDLIQHEIMTVYRCIVYLAQPKAAKGRKKSLKQKPKKVELRYNEAA